MEATGTTAMDLHELAEAVAKERLLVDQQREGVKAQQTALEATPPWAALQAARADLASRAVGLAAMEATLREQALKVGRRDRTKEPLPGVKIVRQTLFLVTDNQAAAEWARANAPLALRVDENILAKVVMALPVPERAHIPGVSIEENEYGAVRIAKDLGSFYLKKGGADGGAETAEG